jgi:hypothetical protein
MSVAVVRCQRSGTSPGAGGDHVARCSRSARASVPVSPWRRWPEQGHGRAVLPGERRPAAAERSPGRDTQGASGAFRSLKGACSTTEACSELLEVGFSNSN